MSKQTQPQPKTQLKLKNPTMSTIQFDSQLKMNLVPPRRILTVSPSILKLCYSYALCGVQDGFYYNAAGDPRNPYQQGTEKYGQCCGPLELLQQMLNAMYAPSDVYPEDIYCVHCRSRTSEGNFTHVKVGQVDVPLCHTCSDALQEIHNNMHLYISIVLQCGRKVGTFGQRAKKSVYGENILYWEELSTDEIITALQPEEAKTNAMELPLPSENDNNEPKCKHCGSAKLEHGKYKVGGYRHLYEPAE